MKPQTATQHARHAQRFHIVATNSAYAKLCRRSFKRLSSRLQNQIDLQEVTSLEDFWLPAKQAATTLFVSRLADLTEQTAKQAFRGAGSKHLLFVDELPVEAIPARLLKLDIRNPHRLHVAAERTPQRIVELVYRLFCALAQTEGPPSIVDAWVEDENIVLLSASFDRLTVPLKALAKTIGTRRKAIEAFEIDEDGRFLYWPHADAHLGWEQFLQITDPTAALAANQRSHDFNQRYGAAIRALRDERGLKQSDIQGLTERHLRRVEHGEQAASKSTLEALAAAHDLSLQDYLAALAERLGKP